MDARHVGSGAGPDRGVTAGDAPAGDGAAPPPASALAPHLVLRFGVTGHRPPRLDPAHYDAAAAACRRIFAQARAALHRVHGEHPGLFAAKPPELRLVSAMAAGADTVAAEAARDEGVGIVACLPFPAERYAEDFDAADWARAEPLIAAAQTRTALGEFASGDGAAYEAVGRLVLDQSDILIAIWDGDAARGRGGTTQVIAEAIALHQPVIHIDPDASDGPVLMWSGLHDVIPDRPSLDGVQRVRLDTALDQLVTALCAPPDGEGQAALQRYLHPLGYRRGISLAWPLLLLATGARSLAKTRLRAPDESEARGWFLQPLARFARHGAFGAMLTGPLANRFARADSGASHFANRFRSSFTTNFLLAALAVLLALAGLLVPQAKLGMILLELATIGLILLNTRAANRPNLHGLWLDWRQLAERLRLLSITAPIGRLGLRDAEHGMNHPGWVGWHARATGRELPMPEGEFDGPYLAQVRAAALDVIRDQLAYHAANDRALHRAHHQLHRFGDLLFALTALMCVLFVIAYVAKADPWIGGIDFKALVTFVTASFPAVAAALYGIRMQGDFAATADRSRLIARRLGQCAAALEHDRPSYGRLVDRLDRTGDVMLAEVEQWHIQAESRPLDLPG